jgi:hypothetical protein
MAAPAPVDQRPGHKRMKSSSVFKSIIAPKSHKRSPSDGTELVKQPDNNPYNRTGFLAQGTPSLPDHRDQNTHTNPPSPRKLHDAKGSPEKALHKKTKSSVSLRSLGREKDKDKSKDKSKDKQSREPSRVRGEDPMAAKPKKMKSTTNLAGIFSKNKQPKEPKSTPRRDKENTTPPSSATAAGPVQTPIWAQFSSQVPLQETTTTTIKVALNDRRSLEEGDDSYTSQDYSPTKQRGFFDYGAPSVQKQSPTKQRPKSMMVSSNTSSTSILDTFSRQKSIERQPLSDTKGNGERVKESTRSRSIPPTRGMLNRNSSYEGKKEVAVKQESNATRRTNRVMAAVAALNSKAKRTDSNATSSVNLDPKVIDAEFEVVLVSTVCPLCVLILMSI